MTNHFVLGMAKATNLTKAGKLAAATALIQSLLKPTSPAPVGKPDSDVIEGRFTRLDPVSRAGTGSLLPAEIAPPRRRSSLPETLRRIAAGGMPARAPLTTQAPPAPEGAQFVTMTHANQHGQRDYKLYLPGALPCRAATRFSRTPCPTCQTTNGQTSAPICCPSLATAIPLFFICRSTG